MKTMQKGIFKDFLATIIWILTTIFSILKSAFIFIIHLFFYKNVSITPDEVSDEITNLNTNEDDEKNKSIDNTSNSKYDEYNSIIETESNDEKSITDDENQLNDESETNEEDEREKIKEELQKEDEEDSQNNSNTKDLFSKSLPIEKKNSDSNENESTILHPQENKEQNRLSSQKSQKDNEEDSESDDYELSQETKKEIAQKRPDPNKKLHTNSLRVEEKDSHLIDIPIKEKHLSNLTKLHRESSKALLTKVNNTNTKKSFPPEFLEKRRSAINSLIDSEEEYRRYLNVLLDFYRTKINGIIDKETNDLMFGNVKPLIVLSVQYSNMFHEELKKGPDEAEISKCFSNVPHTIQQFLPFILNYKKSLSVYKKLLATNILFMIYVKRVESNNSNLRFTYLYSLPTHRFIDYISLLKEILKVTPQWHTDYQEIPKVLIMLRELSQEIEKQCKDHDNEIKLRQLQHQIIGCPTLSKPGCRYIRSFKLFDWKKLYILSDMLLITRGKRLRKKIDLDNIRSIWLDNNTGTIHLRIPNRKDIKIRGGLKGNEIYAVLKTQINQKSSEGGSPPPQTSHDSFMYRRSDLVRPLPPTSDLSAFDESSVNTEIESNSFTNSFFSNSTTEANTPVKSTFILEKDNKSADNACLEDTSDDSYSDSDNNFSEIPDVTGSVEESESIKSDHNDHDEDNDKNNAETNVKSDNDDSESEKFSKQMLHDRKVAIDNLIESEKNYQQNLQSIVNLYKQKFSKSIINEKTEQAVFGNVASLIVLSEQTNNTLKNEIKKGVEKAEIWKCYTITPQYIKFYHSYIINYNDMLSHYNDFVISDKKIKKFVKKIEEEDPQHRFTALSVMPFVRIPTLIKQLQTIIDSTPDWHADYINLPDAISALNSISSDSNKMCTEAENLNKLIQIETSIIDCPSLFSENRSFLKAFVLNDKSSIFVLNDIIVFSRSNRKFKYYLSFSDIKKISNKLNSISLTMNDGKSHSIKSNDQTQKIYDFLKEQKAKQAITTI